MRQECYFCHIKTIEKLINKFQPETKAADIFIFAVHDLLAENRDMANPYLARQIHRIARKHLNNNNLYKEEKHEANTLLLDQYAKWQNKVRKSEDPFHTAAKLAVIGNIIDYGAHSAESDITNQIISNFSKVLAIDETEALQDEIRKARSVLYLGDNAGEIVFDRIFIETMKHNNVTYAVRGKPVINDVTIEDAHQCGIDNICRIISNGYDAPSTLLEYCSEEFIKEYLGADLIISKGQGNFEGLMESKHPNLFFMLMAKCKPMAEMLNVKEGDIIITKLKQ